jgi:hydrogenase maturation protease
MSSDPEILILGIGNEILTDDGIGVKIVKLLEKNFNNVSINYETIWVGGLDLIEVFDGYKIIIIIDAIKTGEKEPGFIWDLTPENFRDTLHLSNIHDLTFIEAINAGRKLGYKIPESIHVLAIEILEDTVFSKEFSSEIQHCYDRILESIVNKIKKIINSQ